MRTKSELERMLKDCFGGSARWSSKIDVDGDDSVAHLHLPSPASNMQDNESAFEAWALALRLLGFTSVALSWDESNVPDHKHYNRFLYRIVKFKRFFSWLKTEQFDSSHIFGARVSLFLNHPCGSASVKSNPKSESAYEERLYRSSAFRVAHGIAASHLVRQLPVGVFTNSPPTEQSALFCAKSSAIDLCGIDKNGTLKLFELKVEGNIGVGALSEVFFYFNVLEDVRQGRISPSGVGALRDSTLGWEDLAASKRIENFIVSSGRIHPIVKGICASEVLKPISIACIEGCQCK